jgi:hypothetical protein
MRKLLFGVLAVAYVAVFVAACAYLYTKVPDRFLRISVAVADEQIAPAHHMPAVRAIPAVVTYETPTPGPGFAYDFSGPCMKWSPQGEYARKYLAPSPLAVKNSVYPLRV